MKIMLKGCRVMCACAGECLDCACVGHLTCTLSSAPASGHNTGTGGREEETLDTLPVTGTTCSQETQGCRGDMDHVTLTMGHVETPE